MDDQARVRDSRQPGHFWADNEIIDEYLPEIGVYGFAVYMVLARFADFKTGQCDPSVSGMAKRLGLSAPTVRNALDKLKEAGLITIRHRSKERDGKRLNQTSVYTILAIKKAQKAGGTKPHLVPNDIDQGVLNVVDQGTKPDLVGVLNHVSTNKTHENKTHLTRESEGDSPAHTPVVKAYFEAFPNQTLTASQVTAINDGVADLPRWRSVLKDWVLNGWSAKAIGKMLDRYASGRTLADDRPTTNSKPQPEPDRPSPPPYQPRDHKPTDTKRLAELRAKARESGK